MCTLDFLNSCVLGQQDEQPFDWLDYLSWFCMSGRLNKTIFTDTARTSCWTFSISLIEPRWTPSLRSEDFEALALIQAIGVAPAELDSDSKPTWARNHNQKGRSFSALMTNHNADDFLYRRLCLYFASSILTARPPSLQNLSHHVWFDRLETGFRVVDNEYKISDRGPSGGNMKSHRLERYTWNFYRYRTIVGNVG